MIAPLRVLHRRTVLVLAVLVPAGLALALGARRSPATAAGTSIPSAPEQSAAPDRDLSSHWSRVDVATLLWEAEGRIELRPRVDLARPDLLVYWQPNAQRAPATEAPGRDARLLGSLVGVEPRRFSLPAEATRAGRARGSLVLWSLAHGERADALDLEADGR